MRTAFDIAVYVFAFIGVVATARAVIDHLRWNLPMRCRRCGTTSVLSCQRPDCARHRFKVRGPDTLQ